MNEIPRPVIGFKGQIIFAVFLRGMRSMRHCMTREKNPSLYAVFLFFFASRATIYFICRLRQLPQPTIGLSFFVLKCLQQQSELVLENE